MEFRTHVQGIPCRCRVVFYTPDIPMRVYGPGMADADPPEEGDFLFQILDRKGYPAPWLEKKMTAKDEDRIYEEFLVHRKSEDYGFYDH